MADRSKIEWCDATWQPITGCAVVSPGCTNCYAMRLAGTRLRGHPSRRGLTRDTKAGPVWTGGVRFNEQWLDQPLKWRKPRRIFVCAHGDLFAEAVPDEWIDRVFAVMALAPQHQFLVLTKRARRMREYLAAAQRQDRIAEASWPLGEGQPLTPQQYANRSHVGEPGALVSVFSRWPFPNVWAGVSAEDQPRADKRIAELAKTPAARRFISYEPALGPLDILSMGEDEAFAASIDMLISGGESGPAARPAPRQWFRQVRDQCRTAGIYYFHKQNGEWIDADEWWAMHRAGPARITLSLSGQEWDPATPLNYADAASIAQLTGDRPYEHQSDGTTLIRVGKSRAGQLLDGRTHSEWPA